MTACIIHSADVPVERAAWSVARAAGFEPIIVEGLQDYGSRLYREPDAIGILWSADGFSAGRLVREYRQAEIANRLIVLLADTGDWVQDAVHRARTLMGGADDAQPAKITGIELMARLKAVAERGAYIDHLAIKLPNGCTYFDDRKRIDTPHGDIRLRPREGDILRELGRKPDQTLSKADLMDALYGGEDEPELKIIDVLVCNLRRKLIEATGGLDCVATNWGRGYRFVPEGFEVARGQFRTRGVRRLEAAGE